MSPPPPPPASPFCNMLQRSHCANATSFVPRCCVFGRPVGGGDLRDSDAQQRQQRPQTDHRQADGPLRLPERPDRRHDQGEAGMCRR